MYPRLLLILLLPLSLFAQKNEVKDTIDITMKPAISTRVVLYTSNGAQQKYINYVDAVDGEFKLAVPTDLSEGMYRLVYNQKTMEYLDFLYAGGGLKFQFNPEDAVVVPVFENSKLNTTYFARLEEFGSYQMRLDALQVDFFEAKDVKSKQDIVMAYKAVFSDQKTKLDQFLITEQNPLIKDLIKANMQVKPASPIVEPIDYLPYIKAHYFDNIDFNNTNLVHSTILVDKVIDYVFYLTKANDPETQSKLHIEAVSNVLDRIEDVQLRKGFIQTLIQSFTKNELYKVTDYLFAEYYDKLPLGMQNSTYKSGILQELKTAVGRIAPNFEWKEGEDNKVQTLENLAGYDNYIIVFWSTSCPHCLKEVPKLHEYLKANEKIKVILVGLQTEEDKGAWKSETYYYPEFTHVLALGKWENAIVQNYNVNATPSYYVLDADKKIIAKPFEYVDLKDFFSKKK